MMPLQWLPSVASITDHIKDQTDAFYKLNDKGDLESLDYDKYIKNNKDLFPDEEE